MCRKRKSKYGNLKSGVFYVDILMVVCFSLYWALKNNII
jgi:hypothetical protein